MAEPVTVALALAATVPRSQVMLLPTMVQDPCDGVAETITAPLARRSSRLTPVASDGPMLVIRTE